MGRVRSLFGATLVLLALIGAMSSPITIPLTPEGEIDNVIPSYFGTKKLPKEYHKISPNQTHAVLELDLDLHDSCGLDFHHQWTVHTGSAIYSTPVIFPAGDASEMKNIFVSSYFNYIEVIQGDGYRPTGWPIAFEDSSFQTSPLVFDIDNDGNTDIGVVDRDANLFWIRTGEFGSYLEDFHIQVPKLRILRDWYEQVKDNFKGSYVMISMFDRYQVPNYMRTQPPSRSPALRKNATAKHAKLDPFTSLLLKAKNLKTSSEPVLPPSANGRRRLLETSQFEEPEEIRHFSEERHMEEEEEENHEGMNGEQFDVDMTDIHMGEEAMAPEEAIHDHEPGHSHEFLDGDHADVPFYGYGGEGLGEESMYGMPGRHVRGMADDGISYYMSRRQFEENEEDADSKFVNVDPHVLATPAMGDINGDGHMEIVFPVSYYFDAQDYLTTPLPAGVDGDMYVASGLVCWDMQAQEWSWTVHLDLTTAKSKFQGLMYASPTIADLDGDKRMEVIVGTSMGMLYVVDGESGFVRHNFPVQLNSIQAQVAVADVTGGFEMEMIIGDMGGNLIVMNVHGDVIWDRQLSGTLPYTASIGDVDGDGQLDIVVVSVVETTVTRKTGNKSKKTRASKDGDSIRVDGEETETIRKVKCHIWALRGDTGETIPGFPIALPQEETISGPVLLLHDYAALTRYIEAQQLHQEESTLVSLLNSFSQASFFTTNKTSSVDKETQELNEMKARREAIRNVHDIAEASDRVHELKEHSISSASLLGDVAENDGVYLIIPGFQGHLYVVALAYDGLLKKQDFCMQKYDIGSPIAASPLLEDVTGDGYLDLIISTLPGEVMVYETNMPRHAGNIWDSFPRYHRRSFSTGDLIISIPESERQRLKRLETRGEEHVTLEFDIFDHRCSAVGGQGQSNTLRSLHKMHPDCGHKDLRSYHVTITRGKSNAREPLWSETFDAPGHYKAVLPLQGPDTLTLLLSVTTEHGLYSEDSLSIALSTHFYVWLKYFIVLPVLLFCVLSLSRLPTMLMNLMNSQRLKQRSRP